METLFSSPAMEALTQTILLIETLSLGVMIAVMWAANRARRTRRNFVQSLGPDDVEGSVTRGELRKFSTTDIILLWVYIAATLGIMAMSIYLFVVQPHFL